MNIDEKARLSKIMSQRGLCSRREADVWIEKGWVFVDGQQVTQLGTRILSSQTIEISKAARQEQKALLTLILHKPLGYVSGQAEDGYRPATVLVTPENHWPKDPIQQSLPVGRIHGLAPAGRLDIDSTGLLVLTQDGRVAKELIGDHSLIEKEYLVRVEGDMIPGGIELLNHGLKLDGRPLKPAKVTWQNGDQLKFVLREGKKRQIRRMCDLVGLRVTGLKRVRIGQVRLGSLPSGQWRHLASDETFS